MKTFRYLRRRSLSMMLGCVLCATATVLAACSSSGGSASISTSANPAASGNPSVAQPPSSTQSAPSVSSSGVDPSIRKLFPASVLKKGELILATGSARSPFSFYDPPGSKNLAGADADLGRAVAKLAGIRASFTILSQDSLVPALNANRVDIAWFEQVPSSSRLKVVSFVNVAAGPLGILVKSGNPEHITKVSDFCGGKKLGIVKGSVPALNAADIAQKQCKEAGKSAISVTTYSSETAPQLAVKTGQIDGMLDNGATTAYVAKTADNGKAYNSVFDRKTIPVLPTGYAFRKSDNSLREAVAAALQKLVDNGTYDSIFHKYGLDGLEVKQITLDPRA